MKRAVKVITRLFVTTTLMVTMFVVPRTFAWSAPESRLTGLIQVAEGQQADLPFPATHLVVRWNGATDAVVQVRGQSSDKVWHEWHDAQAEAPEDAANPVEDGRVSAASADVEESTVTQESGLVVVEDVTKIEARVVSGDATDIRVAAIDTENGPRHLEVVEKKADRAEAIAGTTPQPAVISRSQWGADESIRRGTPEFAPINKVIVHHTVTSNSDPNPAATVRAIYAWHVQGNGWNDIGYNFLIDQNGGVYEGRRARTYAVGEQPTAEDANGNGVIGAHAVGSNTGSIGIALLGTFNTAAPTAAQQNSLTRMMAWETDRHGLNPTAPGVIIGHRDAVQTECPGDGAYALLPSWRQQAAAISTLSFPAGKTPGYWVAQADGGVTPFGTARNLGSMAGKALNSAVISMATAPDNNGYWLLARDGGIFSFGSASFYGSTGAMRLNQPIVAMAKTPSGKGYWLVASDGGIFSFGDAKFYGSTGAMRLNQPVVGMAPTPSGNGYWLVAADGGIFSFGDAQFYGSTGSLRLNSPVTTIATAPGGNGYWLVADDGGVFAFNQPFYGSVPMLSLKSFGGVAQAVPTSTGKGYYMLSRDGGVYTFGDARFLGAPGRTSAAMAVLPE